MDAKMYSKIANRIFFSGSGWPTIGGGVKGKIKLFQNMLLLHIKLKGITGPSNKCTYPVQPVTD